MPPCLRITLSPTSSPRTLRPSPWTNPHRTKLCLTWTRMNDCLASHPTITRTSRSWRKSKSTFTKSENLLNTKLHLPLRVGLVFIKEPEASTWMTIYGRIQGRSEKILLINLGQDLQWETQTQCWLEDQKISTYKQKQHLRTQTATTWLALCQDTFRLQDPPATTSSAPAASIGAWWATAGQLWELPAKIER